MALVLLLLITALASAMLASARLRLLTGSRQLAGRRAFEAARGAVERQTAEWDSSTAASAGIGVVVGRPSAHASPGLVTHDSTVRLGVGLYLVKSTAVASSQGGAVVARDGASRLIQVIPTELLEDSLTRARLEVRLLRSSRDNVAILLPVTFITNGWSRWF
jgi:hypothetical protein